MKRGFTLVELSIVLVIIGLLIGGILVAQSMTNTAKITAQIRQFQQFDIAVTNFKTKFGQLPGDNTIFPLGGGSTYGNNDGIIDDGPASTDFHAGDEFGNFWAQLSSTQMLQDGISYTYTSPTFKIYNNVQIPASKVNDKNVGILGFGIPATGNYYMMISSGSPVNGLTNNSTDLPDLAALDTKMDDGIPGTGKVLAMLNVQALTSTTVQTGLWCVNPTTLGYNLKGSSTTFAHTCLPRIEMFSQVGGSS